MNEAVFFAERSAPGSLFIFDDWKTYNTHLIREVLNEYGFEFISNGDRKMIMQRPINELNNKKDNSKS